MGSRWRHAILRHACKQLLTSRRRRCRCQRSIQVCQPLRSTHDLTSSKGIRYQFLDGAGCTLVLSWVWVSKVQRNFGVAMMTSGVRAAPAAGLVPCSLQYRIKSMNTRYFNIIAAWPKTSVHNKEFPNAELARDRLPRKVSTPLSLACAEAQSVL